MVGDTSIFSERGRIFPCAPRVRTSFWQHSPFIPFIFEPLPSEPPSMHRLGNMSVSTESSFSSTAPWSTVSTPSSASPYGAVRIRYKLRCSPKVQDLQLSTDEMIRFASPVGGKILPLEDSIDVRGGVSGKPSDIATNRTTSDGDSPQSSRADGFLPGGMSSPCNLRTPTAPQGRRTKFPQIASPMRK